MLSKKIISPQINCDPTGSPVEKYISSFLISGKRPNQLFCVENSSFHFIVIYNICYLSHLWFNYFLVESEGHYLILLSYQLSFKIISAYQIKSVSTFCVESA